MMPARLHVAAPALLLALAAPAGAQTTPTQKAAAAPVVSAIDSLQSALRPTEMATRLATRRSPARDAVLAAAGRAWDDEMQGLSDWIGHHPEVGFKEVQAVDTLAKVLRAKGFDVQVGVAGLPTSFVATWTSPAGADGPTLGLIGEYDALRGTKGDFHGDQHNAQTPVAISAAQALMRHMTTTRTPGRVVIYGTPAEEIGPPAKTTMWEAGVFKGADIIVRTHGTGAGTSRSAAGFGTCCLNINMAKYVFTGRPSHQMTSWNGRNALEAAVMFYTAVDRLRSSLRPESVIQGVIPEGGIAPNVVPDRAVVDFYLRYPDEVYLAHIDSMVANAARGAALATGTQVEIQRYGSYRDGITVGTLQELAFAYAKALGAPKLDETLRRPSGYEETGWMTRDVPGVGISVWSSNSSNHTYEMTADNFNAVGHAAFRLDAQIAAAVLFDFLTDTRFREAVRTEHRTMAALFDQYLAGLRAAYAAEMRP